MVNGINSNFKVQNVQFNKPKEIVEQNKIVTNPIDNYTMAGLESLGVYNMSLVKNKDNFNHKPAELIVPADANIDDIKGEQVCDPNGKLEYVVQNDGKYETRYYPHDENKQKVGDVEVRNAYDGKLLKKQSLGYDCNWVDVTEYSQEANRDIKYITSYRDNKIDYIYKEEKMPNGTIKRYGKDFSSQTPELSIRLEDNNRKNSMDGSFDSQNVVKNIYVGKSVGNVKYYKNMTLNKGAIIGINESKDTVVPNFMEREVLNDPDVIPADKFDKDKLEAVAKSNPKDIYSFYGNGRLKEINDKNIKVEFNEDGSQYIREYISDNITKTTSYNDDGITVHYQNGDTSKDLEISSDNKPRFYNIAKNGKCVRDAVFTDEGYLKWCD